VLLWHLDGVWWWHLDDVLWWHLGVMWCQQLRRLGDALLLALDGLLSILHPRSMRLRTEL
jgi:hypothetical protein